MRCHQHGLPSRHNAPPSRPPQGPSLPPRPKELGRWSGDRGSRPAQRGWGCAAAISPRQGAGNDWSPPRPPRSERTPPGPWPPTRRSGDWKRPVRMHIRRNTAPTARSSRRASFLSTEPRRAHSTLLKPVGGWEWAWSGPRLGARQSWPVTALAVESEEGEQRKFSWLG